jgi:hypothetical protein
MEGNVFAVKNKTLKVSLPSLGFIMIAKMEDESVFGRETPYTTIHLSIQNEAQQQ